MKGLIALLAVLLALGVMFFFYASPACPPAGVTEAEIARIEAGVTSMLLPGSSFPPEARFSLWRSSLLRSSFTAILLTRSASITKNSSRQGDQ